MINPPAGYKIIKYKEWAGRYLPKTACFYVGDYGASSWLPISSYERYRWRKKDSIVAIPNNHIPRSKIRETNKIRRHCLKHFAGNK